MAQRRERARTDAGRNKVKPFLLTSDFIEEIHEKCETSKDLKEKGGEGERTLFCFLGCSRIGLRYRHKESE